MKPRDLTHHDNGTRTGIWHGRCGQCEYGVLSTLERRASIALMMHEWEQHNDD